MDFLTLVTKYLGVEFDETFIMQCGDCGEMRCKIDRMGLWEYRTSLTQCQLINNDLVKLLSGEYKIKQIDKKEDSEKILPIPCTKVEEKTVKDWFSKINEELDELKEAVTNEYYAIDGSEIYKVTETDTFFTPYGVVVAKQIAEKATDTITAITSMLEAMGIDKNMRQEAQRKVNERNKECGRF